MKEVPVSVLGLPSPAAMILVTRVSSRPGRVCGSREGLQSDRGRLVPFTMISNVWRTLHVSGRRGRPVCPLSVPSSGRVGRGTSRNRQRYTLRTKGEGGWTRRRCSRVLNVQSLCPWGLPPLYLSPDSLVRLPVPVSDVRSTPTSLLGTRTLSLTSVRN